MGRGGSSSAEQAPPRVEGDNALQLAVVDDDPVDRRVLISLLSPHGECHAFGDAETLLASEHLACFDCIFADYRLPATSGLELVKQLRRKDASGRPVVAVPVVLVTGQGGEVLAVEAMRAGACDYVLKDHVSGSALERALHHASEQRRRWRLADELELTERLAAVGRLASGVAHEINNPTTYILENLRQMTLMAKREDLRPAELTMLLEETVEGVERIGRVVSQLSQLGNLRPQGIELVRLSELAAVAVRLHENRLHRSCQLVVDLDEGHAINGDRAKLLFALTTLIDNALRNLEGTEERGGRVSISARSTATHVVVTVADNGPSLSKEVAGTLFAPFGVTEVRAQSSGTAEGMGIGLALARAYVANHGGRTWHEDNQPHGCKFIIELPRDTGLVPAPTRAKSSAMMVRERWRIALIDDDEAVLRSIARGLRRTHEVVTFSGGQAALEGLAKEHFDIVLCDLAMPGVSGADVIAWIDENSPELSERVVLCTGGALTKADAALIERFDPARVLFKPTTVGVLDGLLERLVRRTSDRP